MNHRGFRILILLFAFLTLTGAAVQAGIYGSPVELQKAVYFPTLKGDMVRFEAGSYILKREEASLKIIPAGAGDGLLLQTTVITHDQDVAGPVPLSILGKGEFPDIHMLVLLLPGGDALRVVGSYSGVMPRGLFSKVKKAVKKTTKTVTNAAEDAVDTAKDVGDAVEDAGDWAVDQVENAAEALKLDKINLFKEAQNAADKAFAEAEKGLKEVQRLQLEALEIAMDPKRQLELLEEVARLQLEIAKMEARALELAWQATVDAATWLYDEAQAYLQIMVCKAMIGIFQGLDLLSELSGPVADAINAAMTPVTAGIEKATELAGNIPGVEEFQQQIGGVLEGVMEDIAVEASNVLTMMEELNVNDQFTEQLKDLLFSPAVCELSASEIRSRIDAILGPQFAMAAEKATAPTPSPSAVTQAPQGSVTGKIDSAPVIATGPAATEPAKKPTLDDIKSAPAIAPRPAVTSPEQTPAGEKTDAAPAVTAKPSPDVPASSAATLKEKLARRRTKQETDRPEQTKLSKWKSPLRPQSRGDLAAQDQVWAPASAHIEQVYAGNACAQTFTVKKTGVLSRVAFKINRNAWTSSDLTLHIMKVDPSGIPDPSGILFSQTLSPMDFPFDPSDVLTEIELVPAGIRVNPGDRFALAVSASGPTNYNWYFNDGYSGGNGYIFAMGEWSPHDGDFLFQTEVISAEEYDTIKNVASRGKTGEEIVPITEPDEDDTTPIEPEKKKEEKSSVAKKRYIVVGIESAIHIKWFTGEVFIGWNPFSETIVIAPAVAASASIKKGGTIQEMKAKELPLSFTGQVAYYWREPADDSALSWDRFYIALSFLGAEGRRLPMVAKQTDVGDEYAWFYRYGVEFIGSPAEIIRKLGGAGKDQGAWENIFDCFTGINVSFYGRERKKVRRDFDPKATESGNLNYSFMKAFSGLSEADPLPGVDAPPRRQYFLDLVGISLTAGYGFDIKY